MIEENVKTWISDIPFLKHLDEEALAQLIKHNQILTFTPGVTILKQGTYTNGIYLLLKGEAIGTVKILDQGINKMCALGQGDFFGEISLSEQEPCPISVVASSEIECLFISESYMKLIGVFFPETKYKIMLAIAKQNYNRIQKMQDSVINHIKNSDMATTSIFGKVIKSLTKPRLLAQDEQKNLKFLVNQIPIFDQLTKFEIDTVLTHIIFIEATKSCTIIQKGDEESSCYIVLRGAIQSSIIEDNKIAKLSVIGPFTLFCNTTCLDKKLVATIDFTAREPTILLKITQADLIFFQSHNIALWYKIFDAICKSLAMLEKSVNKLNLRLNIETYNR